MATQQLSAEKRTITGRKVKQLRKKDILPASVYGKKVKSTMLQMSRKEFEAVYETAGETGVIELTGLGQVRPVLVKGVQVHPVTQEILHVDFHQVDLTEKVKSNIPIEVVGEAQAVADKKGVLLSILDAIEVEALPTDLPEKITVDVAHLAEVGDVVKVVQLSVPTSVAVLTDGELEVVKIDELITKEAEEQAKSDEEAAAEQAAESEEGKEEEEKDEKDEKDKEGDDTKEDSDKKQKSEDSSKDDEKETADKKESDNKQKKTEKEEKKK